MTKYEIDPALHGLAKLHQPMNNAYFAVANLVLRPFKRILKEHGCDYKRIQFDGTYGRVKIHLIRPTELEGKLACIVYYHGGAFMRQAAPHHYKNARRYALNCRCALAFVEFCLAPKNRSTRIEGQYLEAYGYLVNHADELGLDGAFMTAGDSSGGFLAIKVIKLARQSGLPLPKCNMLLYPLIYGLEDTDSVKNYTDTPVWNSTILPEMWKRYLDDGYEWVTAKEVALPTYMEIAEFDCLHDADVRFCREIELAGAPVQTVMTKRTLHGFDAVDYDTTRACLESRYAFIKKWLIWADI